MFNNTGSAHWGQRTFCLAAALAAAWFLAAGRAADGQPSRPAGGPGAARASSPASARAAQLADACQARSRAMLEKLGKDFTSVVQPPFVVIGNLSVVQLKRLTEATVLAPAEAMWASYFHKRPDDVITVLLFEDEKSYRRWAKELFDDADVAFYGYYRSRDRTLVMNISTGGGTLVHELTHALIVYDFPDVPQWFNEGLASLHEQCNVEKDRVVGLANWRLPALQKAVKDKTLRSLRDLVTKDDFYGAQQGMNYAQGRYFVMYMQERGLLREFYKQFRENHTGKDAAVKVIEAVFRQKLDEVEADCLKWVMTLHFPPR